MQKKNLQKKRERKDKVILIIKKIYYIFSKKNRNFLIIEFLINKMRSMNSIKYS